MVKIGIYARGLSEKVGGVKQYIESITKSIVDNAQPSDELFIFHNCKNKYFNFKKSNVKEIILKSKNKIVCDFILCPYYVHKYDLDVVWFSKSVIPFFIRAKTVLTVHDLDSMISKYRNYPFFDALYMKIMVNKSCSYADKIVADSKNTKHDIVKFIGINGKKINVVYASADKKYRSINDKRRLNATIKKYKLPEKFILFTGGIFPRKNLERLIKSFNKISDKIPHELVITGVIGWKNKNELLLLKKSPRVRKIGFVSDEDMPAIYNIADFYIYPSLYEGFGLPVIEAQACGCPVTCSNTSSIPEVGGNAVLYFDPEKIDEIIKCMLEMANNKELKKELIRKGFENSKRFDLNNTARKLLKICKSV